jgi:hypothetical protein
MRFEVVVISRKDGALRPSTNSHLTAQNEGRRANPLAVDGANVVRLRTSEGQSIALEQ